MNQKRIEIIKRHLTKMNPEEARALVDEMQKDGDLPLLRAALDMIRGVAHVASYEAPEPKKRRLVLLDCGDKKIQVIKAIREITSLGLKEAKVLADSAATVASPAVCERTDVGELLRDKAELDAAGALTEIR